MGPTEDHWLYICRVHNDYFYYDDDTYQAYETTDWLRDYTTKKISVCVDFGKYFAVLLFFRVKRFSQNIGIRNFRKAV